MTTTTNPLQAGAILSSSWGYEQTNVDFYEVTRATAKTVWLRRIEANREASEAFMQYTSVPRPGRYTGEEFRRKIRPGGRISITSYALAAPWDGKPERGSSYA